MNLQIHLLVYSTDCACHLAHCHCACTVLVVLISHLQGRNSCCDSTSRGTIKFKTRLPDGACERHLSDIYHGCGWILSKGACAICCLLLCKISLRGEKSNEELRHRHLHQFSNLQSGMFLLPTVKQLR